MAPSVAHFLCVFLSISSLQAVVMAKKEQVVLTVYGHETRGLNGTVLAAAGTGQGDPSKLGWGSFLVVDNPVKEGVAADSKVLGKFTGFAVITTIGGIPTGGFQAVDSFVFGEGSIYNGSTIKVVGTFAYGPAPYEFVIVGGTGFFRGYHGYALATPVTPATPPLFVNEWKLFLHK